MYIAQWSPLALHKIPRRLSGVMKHYSTMERQELCSQLLYTSIHS